MTDSQACPDSAKLRAFEQLMHQEGAAAFAAGPAPWEEWSEGNNEHAWEVFVGAEYRNTGPRPVPTAAVDDLPGMTLLTGLTRVLVLVLLAGVAGVYLSSVPVEQHMVQSGIQPPPIMLAGAPPATGTARTPDQAVGEYPVIPDFASLPAPAAGPDTIVVDNNDSWHEITAIPQAELYGEAPQVTELPGPPPAASQEPELQVPAPTGNEDNQRKDALLAMQPGTADTMVGIPSSRGGEIMRNDATPEPAAESPATADATTPEIPAIDVPQTAAGESAGQAATAPAVHNEAAVPDTVRWVVNLASYNNESYAQRMLKQFRAKGVEAELVHVTVNGRDMVRLRTTGHDSYREALDWADLLEERLDLQGAWVSKRN